MTNHKTRKTVILKPIKYSGMLMMTSCDNNAFISIGCSSTKIFEKNHNTTVYLIRESKKLCFIHCHLQYFQPYMNVI